MMIDFFAIVFLVGLVGSIIFTILRFIVDDYDVFPFLTFICFIVMLVSGIGMEVEKAKDSSKHECKCEHCLICDEEIVERR